MQAFEDYQLDAREHRLLRGGRMVPLEPKAFALLAELVRHPDELMTRDGLLDSVWGHRHVTPGVLNRAVAQLRRALGDDVAHPRFIQTVHGVGFRFIAPVTEHSARSPGRDAGLAAHRIHSIAVLPLDEVGEGPEPLADGLAEALIGDLARTDGLKVISRNSSARLGGGGEDLAVLAGRVGVEALVTGSVRRVDDRVRVSVELVEPASARVIWAGRYDRRIEDVLRLQAEIAHAIAVELRVRVGDGPPRLPRQVVPDAHLLRLRGDRLVEARSEEGFREALLCFEHALDLDPSDGDAWLGIARCHNMLANYGIAEPSQALPRARAAVERAAAFGAAEAEVRAERAQMLWQFEFDWVAAEQEYEQTLLLAPGSAHHWYWYGMMLAVSGRSTPGLEAMERSRVLDPLSPLVEAGHAWGLYFARRHAEAVDSLRAVIGLHPGCAPAYWFLGMALDAMGRPEAAIDAYGDAIERTGRISRLLGYMAHACGRAGREDEARRLLDELEARAVHGYVPPYFLALGHAGLDEGPEALARLEAAWGQRDCMLRDLRVDASFDGLRGSPRFIALLERVRLPLQP